MTKKASVPVVAEGQLEIADFKGKEVRKVFHEDEWYFSVIDVIDAVAESPHPRRYWSDLKRRLVEQEGFDELYEKIVQLKMPSSDGKLYLTDAADTETLFRIIQSIPTKRTEPFKRWLAKVGYERILEYQNPEIAIKRAMLDYKMKGYDDEWIEARVRGMVVRNELTGEWAKRGVEGNEYAILTNVIHKETFGIPVQTHHSLKNLKKHHNLRDHMTDMELIFTMLGEKSTTNIAVASDAQGFKENERAATDGGRVAGNARMELERKTNRRVISSRNYLPPKGDQGRLGTP
jgi:hypothetical protein